MTETMAANRRRRHRGTRGLRANALGALLVTLLAAAPPPDSPVADAAQRGDDDAVRALLARGADVNAAQGDGMTALHWAAYNADGPLARMLLDAGAGVAAVTRIGSYTPLHLAAREAATPVVEALLDAGADAEAVTTTGARPLHFAAAAGDAPVIATLLEHGAEVDARESAWDQTPLMFAADAGRVEALRVLLAHGADVSATAKVLDIPARQRADSEDRAERNERLRAAAEGREPATRDRPSEAPPGRGGRAARPEPPQYDRPPEEPEPLSYADLIGGQGGLTALLHATREGHAEAAMALLEAGADIDQPSEGDHTSPMLMAMINGHFDLAMELFHRGADPMLVSDAGATPLFAVINAQWGPKSRYPQQHASGQQEHSYLDVMRELLEAGVDPDVRLTKHLWYMSFNFDLLQIDTNGATPFWRAAHALDVDAMRLLVEFGADPGIPTATVPSRRRGGGGGRPDPSGLPPIPVGGPAAYPIHAASGIGWGEGYAANAHRHVPDGWLAAVRYLVEELGADVNARDENGYTAVHHAASRGDNEMILYLVEHGADVTLVSRAGETTADMANGPHQRTQPYPETVALLESLGAKNNHRCVSC